MDLETFCKELPKVELHAHLNGSLSARTMLELRRLHADAGRADGADAFVDEFRIGAGDSRALPDCFRVFGIAHSLTSTPDALALATKLTLDEFQQDGCRYVELRSTPRATPHMTRAQYLDAIVSSIRQCSRHLAIAAKLLVSIDRRCTPEEALETAELAVQYNGLFPGVVVGMDLSGDPTVGRFREFVPALTRAREAGLKISVHCGEVCNPEEVLDILAFAPERLGHAVCVHPRCGGTGDTWTRLRASNTPVEICLTSNVKCKLFPGYADHHFKEFYENNVPLALCTDDKGVFDTSLSHEYAVCADTFALSRSQIARLALDACSHVFDEGARKPLQDAVLNFIEKLAL